MHASSLENMEKCFRRYVVDRVESEAEQCFSVLDIGGADVNGSYADLFSKPQFRYVGADIQAGPGVSMILDDPYKIPAKNDSFDYVLSGQMLEHCEFFWKAFEEMVRVVKPDGLIFLIAPSSGPIHPYPVDCYRFYPDAYRALASHASCHLIDVWHDQRGPWNDLVGIFSKTPRNVSARDASDNSAARRFNSFVAEDSNPALDVVRGETSYLTVMKRLHDGLAPARYLEIGVRKGRSLALAKCPTLGVDPEPEIVVPLSDDVTIVSQSSDDFFERGADHIKDPLELVFIDGMHLFEYVLRDFMNVEKHSGPYTVVVIDDVLPNLPEQASRERNTRVWTGDVWKIVPCLKKHRPDLNLVLLDTSPTGLLIVTGLQRDNRVLWQRYNPIVREFAWRDDLPTEEVLARRGALSPEDDRVQQLLGLFADAKDAGRDLQTVTPVARKVLDKQPRRIPLSVVVIAYNMARELPRTLLSLSAQMQRDISVDDYEIIVVDNGSSIPFDAELCTSVAPNITIAHHDPDGSPSPVAAISRGLELAQGELVGVMIDGARMASPGLLTTALAASKLSPNAVIGSIAFHLGEEVQRRAVHNGYNQEVEDELLDSVDWVSDGYALFGVSVFAGSSRRGWFSLPSETNALFMSRQKWSTLRGYESQFQSPGGGLANPDMWKRACESPGAQVVLLAGEATFHQFHGGVATNAKIAPNASFKAEYRAIRGIDYQRPHVPFKSFGTFTNVHRDSVIQSY